MSRSSSRMAVIATGLAVALLGTQALAGGTRYETARVEEVVPVYETVRISQPHRECHDERVVRHEPARGGRGGLVAGGIIGGALGSQVGGGSGKRVATVAGSVLGAAVGQRMAERPGRSYTTTETRCHRVKRWYEEDRVVGYRVKYRYRGDSYWTEMDRRPGETIQLRVDVTPVY